MPLRGPVLRKKTARYAYDYKLSIIDHYQEHMRHPGNFSDHWSDKDKRILRHEPIPTEKIFHDNLWSWLDQNIEGGIVLGGRKMVSNDETDIEIRLFSEPIFYIIEIKWLGNNGHKYDHSVSRLAEGIVQSNEYLQRDPNATEVCLVVYDGRSVDEFNALKAIDEQPRQWKRICECDTEKLSPRGDGYVFFLESAAASKRYIQDRRMLSA
jgi:hypothetical protein